MRGPEELNYKEEETENIMEKEVKKEVRKPSHNGKKIVSRDKLMEAGVYFGHRTAQWNPKMKPYILKSMKGTHIIDLQKTVRTLEFAYGLIKKMAERGSDFIFVGTRKQSKATIKENALRTNSYYMAERWLGGTLTNNRTIFQRVKRMFELERLAEKDYDGYTKKEGVLFAKELAKLQKNLSGIKNMRRRPSVMIVADPMNDIIAVKEAKKLGMKVIGLVDTNTDPSIVDIAIPANDDSIKSVTLMITILADAIAEGKSGAPLFAYQPDSAIVLPDELVKERKPRGRRFPPREGRTFQRRDDRATTSSRPSEARPTTSRPAAVKPAEVKTTKVEGDK